MIQKNHSLLNNFIYNLIKTFSSLVFPLVTFTYSARILGEEGIGSVNFAKSFITFFSMFAMLGMNYYGTREVAKRKDDKNALSKFVHEMLMINGVSTAVAYVLLVLCVIFVPKLHGYVILLFISSFAIILQGMGMEWLYQGLEEYRYIAVRSVLFQMISLVIMFIFVRDANDVAAYAIVITLASSGSYLLNFLHVRKYIYFRRYGGYELKKHMKPLLWLFALVVSMELYTVLDSTMLGFLQNAAAVGRYTAAVKVNKLVNTLITSLCVVLIPRLSYYIGRGEHDKVRALVDKAYNYVFMLSVPAAVGLFMLSDEIILLFSGAGFGSASITMRILTPIVIVIPFSITTNQQTLIPMGEEKRMFIATSIGAAVNFACNSILIPEYAENGAAIATVFAETVVAVVSFINASHFFEMKKFFRKYYQYWLAAIPIPVIAVMLRKLPIHYALRMGAVIVISALCYFTVLLLLKNEYLISAISGLLSKFKIKRDSRE